MPNNTKKLEAKIKEQIEELERVKMEWIAQGLLQVKPEWLDPLLETTEEEKTDGST
jgi:hypothetical protein